MEDSQFTDNAKRIIETAIRINKDNSHATLSPLHLLAAMTESEAGEVSYLKTVVEKARYEWVDFERAINKHLVRLPAQIPPPAEPQFSPQAAKVLTNASEIKASQKDSYIGQDHILLALLEDSSIQSLLKELSIPPKNLKVQIQAIRGNRRIDSRTADSSDEYEFLKKYAIDMT